MGIGLREHNWYKLQGEFVCLCVTHCQCDARPVVVFLGSEQHHHYFDSTKLYCSVTEPFVQVACSGHTYFVST